MDRVAVQLNPELRWVQIENAIFVLDLQRGEYSALGPEYVDAWHALADRVGPSAAPPGALADLHVTLERRGWLMPQPAVGGAAVAAKSKSGVRFPMICAFASLSRCTMSLRLRGFARTYREAQQTASRATSVGDAPDLSRALAVFQRVEACFFSSKGLQDCLPRSLALFIYLRRCGIPATHHIGVRRYPFGAHAWVECEGVCLQCAITHGKVQSLAAVGQPEFTDIAVIA